MVSLRCKMIVKSELEKMHLHSIVVELGEVEIAEQLSAEEQQNLKTSLLKFGLELMEDKKSVLIEKIKNCQMRLPFCYEVLRYHEFVNNYINYIRGDENNKTAFDKTI